MSRLPRPAPRYCLLLIWLALIGIGPLLAGSPGRAQQGTPATPAVEPADWPALDELAARVDLIHWRGQDVVAGELEFLGAFARVRTLDGEETEIARDEIGFVLLNGHAFPDAMQDLPADDDAVVLTDGEVVIGLVNAEGDEINAGGRPLAETEAALIWLQSPVEEQTPRPSQAVPDLPDTEAELPAPVGPDEVPWGQATWQGYVTFREDVRGQTRREKARVKVLIEFREVEAHHYDGPSYINARSTVAVLDADISTNHPPCAWERRWVEGYPPAWVELRIVLKHGAFDTYLVEAPLQPDQTYAFPTCEGHTVDFETYPHFGIAVFCHRQEGGTCGGGLSLARGSSVPGWNIGVGHDWSDLCTRTFRFSAPPPDPSLSVFRGAGLCEHGDSVLHRYEIEWVFVRAGAQFAEGSEQGEVPAPTAIDQCGSYRSRVEWARETQQRAVAEMERALAAMGELQPRLEERAAVLAQLEPNFRATVFAAGVGDLGTTILGVAFEALGNAEEITRLQGVQWEKVKALGDLASDPLGYLADQMGVSAIQRTQVIGALVGGENMERVEAYVEEHLGLLEPLGADYAIDQAKQYVATAKEWAALQQEYAAQMGDHAFQAMEWERADWERGFAEQDLAECEQDKNVGRVLRPQPV